MTKRMFIMALITFSTCLTSLFPRAASAQVVVIDPAAIAKIIEQIQETIRVVNELQQLNVWAEIDHIDLAGSKFASFIGQYRDVFNKVMDAITSVKDGGLLGQIKRFEEIYFPYYAGWESQDGPGDFTGEADPNRRALKKQLLWTRIQLEHAAQIGSKIRESIPQTQEQVNVLLADTKAAPGVMQTIKVGNELTATVAKSLHTLNLQFSETLQAQIAEGMQRNTREGLQQNRAREALSGFAERDRNSRPAPLNPFGAY